jgi:hypothetical protein
MSRRAPEAPAGLRDLEVQPRQRVPRAGRAGRPRIALRSCGTCRALCAGRAGIALWTGRAGRARGAQRAGCARPRWPRWAGGSERPLRARRPGGSLCAWRALGARRTRRSAPTPRRAYLTRPAAAGGVDHPKRARSSVVTARIHSRRVRNAAGGSLWCPARDGCQHNQYDECKGSEQRELASQHIPPRWPQSRL